MQLTQSAGPPRVVGCTLLVPPGVCAVGSPTGVLNVGLIVEGHAVNKLTLVLEVQLACGLVLVQKREETKAFIVVLDLVVQLFKTLNLEVPC